MKITLAFDSFKGSLNSLEVAGAFELGLRDAMYGRECEIQKIAIADGGEGTVEALCSVLGGEIVELEVSDPLGRPILARYGVVDQGLTAVMEMSSASGLPLLSLEERNPMLTSTYGFGQMILDALSRGCRKFFIGIGGSATNDGGTGMLSALGYKFLDAEGQMLYGCGASLDKIVRIDDSGAQAALAECSFVLACDVTNPLCGEDGAAQVFAPQKGADSQMVEHLDKGLAHFAECIVQYNGVEVLNLPGAGAAGGLGAAFSAFLGARLERGVEMVLDAICFDDLIAGSDLIVTGEGRMDAQTLMGKAPAGVLKRAAAQGIATVAICGSMDRSPDLEQSGFSAIIPLYDGDFNLEEALKPEVAKQKIYNLAKDSLSLIKLNKISH